MVKIAERKKVSESALPSLAPSSSLCKPQATSGKDTSSCRPPDALGEKLVRLGSI